MRERAAVLIGVTRTGGLQPLKAVESAVHQVQAWAESQPGFRDVEGKARLVLLTDADGAVTVAAIFSAVRHFVERGTIEQLFVYFAGHGVNVRFGEYWLLSGAPDEPNEAVDVRASADLARYCGIPHVVLISDACRVPAASIQAQAVTGSTIFPGFHSGADPGCVDLFYASMVGRPALEVKDAGAPGSGYEAIYTAALVAGLNGSRAELVEMEGEPPVGRVRTWPLQLYLQREVPNQLLLRGVALTVSQKPDAIITSPPGEWLAEVDIAAGEHRPVRFPADPGRRTTRGGRQRRSAAERGPAEGESESLASVTRDALRSVLATGAAPPRERVRGRRGAPKRPGRELLVQMIERVAATPAPGHLEALCGFTVNGIAVASAVSGGAAVELVGGPRGVVCISDVTAPAANVLLVFADGRGALLPAIPGFVAALTYDAAAGELADVQYEPADNTGPYDEIREHLPALRQLRRVVAAAAALGGFRLDEDNRAALLARLQGTKGLDPTLAVYAAYALHDGREEDEIAAIAEQQRARLQLTLFDLALLTRRPAPEPAPGQGGVFPAIPLLVQGWSLLDARDVELPPSLRARTFRSHVTDSLWTLFDETGVAVLRAALQNGEIR